MQYTATLRSDGQACRAALAELSGVSSRQVAEKDRVTSRLYTAWLDRAARIAPNRPVWIAPDGEPEYVGYPVLQKGRLLRLARRDGEFYPGLTLERIGSRDGPRVTFAAGGLDWFVLMDNLRAYRSEDLAAFRDVADLYGKAPKAVAVVDDELVIAAPGELLFSRTGQGWTRLPLAQVTDVQGMVYDGKTLHVAGSGGRDAVRWSDRQVTPVYGNDWRGVCHAGVNDTLYLVRQNTPGGGGTLPNWTIFDGAGAAWRTFDLAASWPGNWAAFGSDSRGPLFVTVEAGGQVVELGKAAARTIGQVAPPPGRAWRPPACFVLRGVVVGLAWGKLFWTNGAAVQEVYDFGTDVQVFPSFHGPLVLAADGLIYRVRRLEVLR